MKRVMAVYDEDPFYAARFADYANQREKTPFTVIAFSSAGRLQEYLEKQHVELLLIGDEADAGDFFRQNVRQIMTLNEGEVNRHHSACPTVYKYQSADNILREVMVLCEVEAEAGLWSGGTGSRDCLITGIYSPVNRCGKTAFSLVYAHTLARESRTLYLNLEDCSGFSQLFQREGRGDFSDVLYYFKQHMLDRTKLSSVIYSLEELDYIPPVQYSEDLCQTDAGELAKVLRHVAAEGGYRTLVVDFGQLGRMAAELLAVCDVIYMPVLEDAVSSAKVEEFENYLEVSQRNFISERIQKLKLPVIKPVIAGRSWFEQILWGEMGDYVRQLINGRDGNWQH